MTWDIAVGENFVREGDAHEYRLEAAGDDVFDVTDLFTGARRLRDRAWMASGRPAGRVPHGIDPLKILAYAVRFGTAKVEAQLSDALPGQAQPIDEKA